MTAPRRAKYSLLPSVISATEAWEVSLPSLDECICAVNLQCEHQGECRYDEDTVTASDQCWVEKDEDENLAT